MGEHRIKNLLSDSLLERVLRTFHPEWNVFFKGDLVFFQKVKYLTLSTNGICKFKRT